MLSSLTTERRKMKFTIKKEIVTTTVKEKTIDIRLEWFGKNLVLMAGCYYVLAIKPDGKVVSYESCELTELNVDDDGHVIIERN